MIVHRYKERKQTYPQGFHKACNNKGPSVSIMITSTGYIFGGVTDQSWGKPLNEECTSGKLSVPACRCGGQWVLCLSASSRQHSVSTASVGSASTRQHTQAHCTRQHTLAALVCACTCQLLRVACQLHTPRAGA